MPKFAELFIEDEELRASPAKKQELAAYLSQQVEDAISARHWQEEAWIDELRMYEAIPKNPARFRPIEGRMPIEVALGAIATDAIYAQELALIFGTSPVITVRATNQNWTEHAKVMQRFSNFISANPEFGLREAVEESLLDKNKLGSGFYYVPWVERQKRTKTRKVRFAGPKIRSVAPEDIIVPGGSRDNIEELPWIGIRLWLNNAELAEKELDGWDTELAAIAASVSRIRQQRERLGATTGESNRSLDLYEIHQIWVDWDIDGDGFAEDLLVIYDRTSRNILRVGFAPYDWRPVIGMRYLRRGHLFYGKGVMSVAKPNQEMATDIMNNWLDNAYLANVRMYIASPDTGLGNTLHAWPGRIVRSNNPDGVKPLQLSDVYSSMPQLFLANQQLTERRTGVNELTQSPLRALGNRTPGITALSALQSQNQRFTAVFDSGRVGTSNAVKQCLYRFHERVLAEDQQVIEYIEDVLGEEAPLALEVLRNPKFDESLVVELTASSASINRDSDRQNALLLANLLGQYYTRTIELVNLAANPQVPTQVRSVAEKVATAAGELIERTIRTFDQVRDPEQFIVDIAEELRDIQEASPERAIAGLFQQLGLVGEQAIGGGPVATEEVPFAGAQTF